MMSHQQCSRQHNRGSLLPTREDSDAGIGATPSSVLEFFKKTKWVSHRCEVIGRTVPGCAAAKQFVGSNGAIV